MINGIKHRALRQHSADGFDLIACECPTCKMLHWHESRSKERRVCPFCSAGQPDYVSRTVPEPVPVRETVWDETVPSGESDGFCPFVLEFFMVQGNGFRCMAYRNADGKWRGAFDDEVLHGAVRVLG